MAPNRVPLPDRHYSQFVINGEVKQFTHEPPAEKYTACDIETLASFTEDNSIVWHCDNTVIAVVEATSNYRDDRVTMELRQSEKWRSLLTDAHKPRMHQEFIRWLVRNLRDELEASAPGLLGIIRNLKFRSLDQGESDVQHGKESMGRSVAREISGAEALPETVTIKLRRWAKLEIFVEVECLLVLDTDERKLALQPLADATEQAEHDAQGQLHELIASAVECPVAYGNPN